MRIRSVVLCAIAFLSASSPAPAATVGFNVFADGVLIANLAPGTQSTVSTSVAGHGLLVINNPPFDTTFFFGNFPSSAGDHVLEIVSTQIDVTAPSPFNPILTSFSFAPIFSPSTIIPVNSIDASAYLDASNTPFATTTLLANHTFNGPLVGQSFGPVNVLQPANLGTFSETTDTVIRFTGDVFDSPFVGIHGTTTVQIGNVPEPSTWAMMLLGFAGIGVVAYRQRRWSATEILINP
jgi:hypothetical protein